MTHYSIPLDDDAGSSNVPRYLSVAFHNGAGLMVPGRVKAALRLEAPGQHVTIDEPTTSCFNNLQLCNSGLCIAFFLKITGPVPDIQLMTSAAYSVRMTSVCFLTRADLEASFLTASRLMIIFNSSINGRQYKKQHRKKEKKR